MKTEQQIRDKLKALEAEQRAAWEEFQLFLDELRAQESISDEQAVRIRAREVESGKRHQFINGLRWVLGEDLGLRDYDG